MNRGYPSSGSNKLLCSVILAAVAASTAYSSTLYVNPESEQPSAPYTNWASAARTIQEAVNVANYRDVVLVTNGVYASGGMTALGTLTNRVVINKAITVQSVNGPQHTIIEGYQVPGTSNGVGAIRCVYMASSAILSGFTLTKGATDNSQTAGGAIYVPGSSSGPGYVTNCVLVGNSASGRGGGANNAELFNCTLTGNWASDGGGAYGGLLDNCTINGNRAGYGGGARQSDLVHCTVFGNSAENGGGTSDCSLDNCDVLGNSARAVGGVSGGTAYNSIICENQAALAANYDSATLAYCCTTPLPPAGTGNIEADPGLASLSHLSSGSLCRNAGGASYTLTTDIDGEAWQKPPSIGCDEYNPGAVTGALNVRISPEYTNISTGFSAEFVALIDGRTSSSAWDFGDGRRATNCPLTKHAWETPGDYAVSLTAYNETHPEGVSTGLVMHVESLPVIYVSAGSTNAVAPFSSWETAAGDIQTAVDEAKLPGTLVLVNDGRYNLGGRAVHGSMTNRVVVDRPVTVRSVNGPLKTSIEGMPVAGSTNGDGAIRCVYLGDGATLSGFTLVNGGTRATGDFEYEAKGGGVWCASTCGVISNCVFLGNASYDRGGAAYGGSLYRCTISNNSSRNGGGVYAGILESCLLQGNQGIYGGGANGSSLVDCTLSANTAYSGGGAYRCLLNNCIAYFNTNQDWSASTLNFTCTPTLPPVGLGNFTNAPSFMDALGGDYHLQPNSPCINAGIDTYVTCSTDLDGLARVSGGTVDVGAYEFQNPASVLPYVWLQSFGLPCDGSADYVDSDFDGMNSWQEWLGGTDPLDASSALRLLSITSDSASLRVMWQSTTNRNYFVERAPVSTHPARFTRVASNIPGRFPTTSFSDTNAVLPQGFYRVGVEKP